jgi:flavin reductase (DIM6/NTAB) family NADH-FMN oxidoreductase RutF
MTANAFLSVSLDPPLVLVSVDKRAKMHAFLLEAGHYGVSVLSEDQKVLSDHFAGRVTESIEVRFIERLGVPLLEGALAHIIARIIEAHPTGDHTLFIGAVEHLYYRDGKPLIFYAGRYRTLSDTEV